MTQRIWFIARIVLALIVLALINGWTAYNTWNSGDTLAWMATMTVFTSPGWLFILFLD